MISRYKVLQQTELVVVRQLPHLDLLVAYLTRWHTAIKDLSNTHNVHDMPFFKITESHDYKNKIISPYGGGGYRYKTKALYANQ